MASQVRVLLIGSYAPLQRSRTLLLNNVGYSVIEVDTDISVLNFLESKTNVELILICHSVENSRKMPLCTALRKQYPATPIAMLCSEYEFTAPQVTTSLERMAGPVKFLNLVHTLASSSCQ